MLDGPDETEKLHVVEINEENHDAIDQIDTVVVVEIESSDEEITNHAPAQSDRRRNHRLKKKKTEAELLKTSLYNDLGLYFNDVMKDKYKVHKQTKDLHVDHISRERRNIIWVHPIFPSEPQYEPLEKEDRNPFIRQVFTMVGFNLLIMILFNLLVLNVEFFNDIFMGLSGAILALAGSLLIIIAVYILNYEYGRSCPCTGISWFMVVLGSCFLLAFTIVKVHIMELVIALVATLAVVLLCIALACTSFDFTKFMIYIAVVGVVLSVFAMGALVTKLILGIKMNLVMMLIACGFALYHSITLIVDIQMVIGGYSLEIDSSQFIFAGVHITLSIVYMFLNILKIVLYFTNNE